MTFQVWTSIYPKEAELTRRLAKNRKAPPKPKVIYPLL
ncbi:hypothetical protein CEV31_1264 [Brucella thiophenivorans]|uniref:Uncharacterized protein n=1 Tax=Brucella thiophenivorans TaxID=571255 RepID=A0A256FYB6_9HYPH|nr:hypothetical protein CEV31_1264 [Brucella thiophenivorans]